MQPALFDRLLPIATAEVQSAIAELPENLREPAQAIATTFEPKPNAGFIADGIEAYTKRHRSRVDRLIRSAYVVDFILGGMGMLLDNEDAYAPPKEEKRSKVPA